MSMMTFENARNPTGFLKVKHSEDWVRAAFLNSATAFDDRFLLLELKFVFRYASEAHVLADNMSQHAYGSSHSVSHFTG